MAHLWGFLTRLKLSKNPNSVKWLGHWASIKFTWCFSKGIFFWTCKLLWKIWQISTWLSPQSCVSTFLGTFLHNCTELQAFFFLFSSLKPRPNFQSAKQICRSEFTKPMRNITWSLHTQLLCSQQCCHAQFLGPDSHSLAWICIGPPEIRLPEITHLYFSEQLPYGFSFPFSSNVLVSSLLLPYHYCLWEKGK